MPLARKDRSALPWACVTLVLGIACLLWAPNPTPLGGLLERLNYHHLHIQWRIYQAIELGLALAAPALLIVVFGVGWRRKRTAAANLLFTSGLALLAVSAIIFYGEATTFDGGYTWRWRERFDALSSVRTLADNGRFYADSHDSHWPPHLATFLLQGGASERELRYRNSHTPALPQPPWDFDDVPSLAASIDLYCDFVYLAGDLCASPDLDAHASVIIVAYGKMTLPEIPQVAYDEDHHVYEYGCAARPVSFADGHSVLVPPEELIALFAVHNATRAKLGLPPHALDVTPPLQAATATR
jgi:hypothetical protein